MLWIPIPRSGLSVLSYVTLLQACRIETNDSQDDSAIRRISLPELYLCADACLILLSTSSCSRISILSLIILSI